MAALCGIACTSGQDCQTVTAYVGYTSPNVGTVTYGQPSITKPFGSLANPAPTACMQAPGTCGSASFGAWGGPVYVAVSATPLRDGQAVALPSPEVSISAYLDDGFAGLPYDGGANRETLTLISGSISIMISLNNFEAQFDMTFARPGGDPVVIQNGHASMLNADMETSTNCH